MRRVIRSSLVTIIFIVVLCLVGVWGLRTWYNHSLQPVSSSTLTQEFTVTSGMGVHDIGTGLEKAGLIRSGKAFETYVRSNELTGRLQAGTYTFSPSMSTAAIVRKMVVGDVSRNLLTILPAKRLDQVAAAFKKAGYSDAQIKLAFEPGQYPDHPALTSLPKGASLEGYLYPDSFQRQSDTTANTIVSESLDEMNKHLSVDITSGFAKQGLTTYQGITLASIVASETDDPAASAKVAQVFLLRLKKNMALGSDVTAIYGAVKDGVNLPSDPVKATGIAISHDSLYNTRIHNGLPPGPIGNVTDVALRAVAHPATTDYLFFLAGDDKKIHFARTAAEHEQNIVQFCTKSCQ